MHPTEQNCCDKCRTYSNSNILNLIIISELPKIFVQCIRNYTSEKNLCSVLYAPRDIRLEEREIPKPKDNQVLVKVNTVGICGTDIHFYRNGAIGGFKINKPFVLGHEGCGIIADLGKNVRGFSVGERVALEPGVSCRNCHYCKSGRYHLCDRQAFKGLPPTGGLFAQYVAHDADFCYKLPDKLTMDDASLLEPFSVGIHGVRKANVKPGSKVLVLGAGPIGLMALLAAKAYGATRIAITDIVDNRLAIAKNIGADLAINVAKKSNDEVVEILKEKFGELPDSSIECVGYQSSTDLSIAGVKTGGCAVFLGLAKERLEIPVMDVVCREIDVRGAIKYANTWPLAIELLSLGHINMDKLTRTYYNLDKIKDGFEKSMKAEFIKVMIKCNP